MATGSSTTRLRIGGVPEHFNLPWHDLLGTDRLARARIEAEWVDYPSGTGAMVADLDSGELDLGVLLTEGAVAGAAAGRRFSILSLYTTSPLIWGVHVPQGSGLDDVEALRGRRFAISRAGSGSHLMAFALARQRGWPTETLEFVTVGGLEGAIEAFAAGRADAFLWEKFMTAPVVAAGRFQRIADFAAPWPAFVVCASEVAVASHRGALGAVIEGALEAASALKRAPDAAARIAERYGLETAAVSEWLAVTAWAERAGIATAHVAPAKELLASCGIIDPAAHVRVGFPGC